MSFHGTPPRAFLKESIDTSPNSAWTIGRFYGVIGKDLLRQYRDFQSGFKDWNQPGDAKKWLLFPENIGSHLSIDEPSLSRGELYTILTNKAAKGGKSSIVAIVWYKGRNGS